MHEDDYIIETLPATPMQVIDVGILVLDAITQVARIPARTLGELTDMLCRHANYKVEQRRFAREATAAIESFVSGDFE